MNGEKIASCDSIRDLGVVMSSDLKFSNHCTEIVRKTNAIIHNMFVSFRGHSAGFYVHLFNLYVRPIIEYASPVWNCLSVGDLGKIEKIQRKFTKRLPNMYNYDYVTRLEILNLSKIETRLKALDLCFLHRILNGDVDLDLSDSIMIRNTHRGHDKNLFKFRSRTIC